jgi:hypothetical protein
MSSIGSLLVALGIWLIFVLVFTTLVGAQSSSTPAPGLKAVVNTKAQVNAAIESVDRVTGRSYSRTARE